MNNDKKKTDNRKIIAELLHACARTMYFHSNTGVQQTRVLQILSDEGQQSQKQLQEKLGIQPATISELISKMERKGHVERARSEADRRVVVIKLTEDGLRAYQRRTLESNNIKYKDITLTQEDQLELIRLLTKLRDGFDENEETENKP